MTQEPGPPERLTTRCGSGANGSERWQREGERSIGQNLAMIGALGWTIVTPTLLGIFAGRWLDRRFGIGDLLDARPAGGRAGDRLRAGLETDATGMTPRPASCCPCRSPRSPACCAAWPISPPCGAPSRSSWPAAAGPPRRPHAGTPRRRGLRLRAGRLVRRRAAARRAGRVPRRPRPGPARRPEGRVMHASPLASTRAVPPGPDRHHPPGGHHLGASCWC